MLSREVAILKQIDESRRAIKQKHLQLKHGLQDIQENIGKVFKPIVQPLNQIASLKAKKKVGIYHSTPKGHNLTPKSQSLFASHHSSPDESTSGIQSMANHSEKSRKKLSLDDVIEEEEEEVVEKEEEVVEKEEDQPQQQQPLPNEDTLRKYLRLLVEGDRIIDKDFSVRHKKNGVFTIGSQPITFDDENIVVKDEKYPKTSGLLELLFKKHPDNDLMNVHDIRNYRKIAKETNLLNKKYDGNKSFIIPSKNSKYLKYLKDLNTAESAPLKSGYGLPKFMVAHSKAHSIDYIYWDDPNELVDRLRLLIAERSAGNNNHDNEIHAIIEELREAGIIY